MRIVSLMLAMAALFGAAFAQEASGAERTSRPIAPEADPINQIAERSTRPALVIALALDGDEVTLGQSSDPNTWIEVRLADFYAPELNAEGGAPPGPFSGGSRWGGKPNASPAAVVQDAW